jgi:hypothetical protein
MKIRHFLLVLDILVLCSCASGQVGEGNGHQPGLLSSHDWSCTDMPRGAQRGMLNHHARSELVDSSLQAQYAGATGPHAMVRSEGYHVGSATFQSAMAPHSPRYVIDTAIVRRENATTRHIYSYDPSGKRLSDVL